MNQRQHHWIEKLQLQIVTVVALVVVYLAGWPLFRSPDPAGALAFLANGSYGSIAMFAAAFWLLAACCAAVTVNGRGEGAMIAVLIGAGGLSLRSGQIRALLWNNMANSGVLYSKLILEVIVLALLLAVAETVISLIRGAIGRVMPGLLWADPLSQTSDQQRREPPKPLVPSATGWLAEAYVVGLIIAAFKRLVREVSPKDRRARRKSKTLNQAASFFGVALIAAAVLVMCLMRSAQRGQILFALLAAFFLAVLIAHQLFPTPYARAAWMLPIVLAVCSYALAVAAGIGTPPQGWIDVRNYARALPLDWLTAGCGGAMLGHWVSARVYEARHFDKQQQEEGVR